MGMGFAPTWLRQVSPPPCFTKPLYPLIRCVFNIIAAKLPHSRRTPPRQNIALYRYARVANS